MVSYREVDPSHETIIPLTIKTAYLQFQQDETMVYNEL